MTENLRSGFKDYLHDCIETYFRPLIEQFQMKIAREFYSDMGALCDAISGALTIRMVNDRGIVNFEISATSGEAQFWDVELISELVDRASTRKLRGNKRLSLKEQARFIHQHWDDLQKRFSSTQINETDKALSKLGVRRANLLLNK